MAQVTNEGIIEHAFREYFPAITKEQLSILCKGLGQHPWFEKKGISLSQICHDAVSLTAGFGVPINKVPSIHEGTPDSLKSQGIERLIGVLQTNQVLLELGESTVQMGDLTMKIQYKFHSDDDCIGAVKIELHAEGENRGGYVIGGVPRPENVFDIKQVQAHIDLNFLLENSPSYVAMEGYPEIVQRYSQVMERWGRRTHKGKPIGEMIKLRREYAMLLVALVYLQKNGIQYFRAPTHVGKSIDPVHGPPFSYDGLFKKARMLPIPETDGMSYFLDTGRGVYVPDWQNLPPSFKSVLQEI